MSDLAAGIVKRRKRDSYTGEEVRRHDKAAAREILDRGLKLLRMELAKLRLLRQSDPRKQALAWLIRLKRLSVTIGSRNTWTWVIAAT
jgi:aryl-alcohol dehydrogenase-like predicted oxidoreductase